MSKVTVLYNLPENDDPADVDTQNSAMEVADGLKNNYKVDLLGIGLSDLDKIRDIDTDFVFNLIEWGGKNSGVGVNAIKLLSSLGIPYSGSDAEGYLLSCDKEMMKNRFDDLEISTPKWLVCGSIDEIIESEFNLDFPVIVKPVLEHCGIGITQENVVDNFDDLRTRASELLEAFDAKVLIEEFIDGREMHVTILEKDGEPWVLPPAEVVYFPDENSKPILTYEAKWNVESPEYSKSVLEIADMTDELSELVFDISKKCYVQMGGRDYPRLDMRVRGGDVYVLEINNNPGIDYDMESGIGLSAKSAGLSWEDLLEHIVENAKKRFKT